MNDIPRVDPQVRAELAREAKDLIENRAFIVAKETLKRQWYGELLDSTTDSQKMVMLVAQLKAVEGLATMLNNLMVAPQFAQRRGTDVR